MTSTSHLNAKFYFDRDVQCVQRYFTKRFGLQFEGGPVLETDVQTKVDLDTEIKASGFATQQEITDFDKFNQEFLDNKPEQQEQQEETNIEEQDMFVAEESKVGLVSEVNMTDLADQWTS